MKIRIPRINVLEGFIHGRNKVIDEMKSKGLWHEGITEEDVVNYAGSHILIATDPENIDPKFKFSPIEETKDLWVIDLKDKDEKP